MSDRHRPRVPVVHGPLVARKPLVVAPSSRSQVHRYSWSAHLVDELLGASDSVLWNLRWNEAIVTQLVTRVCRDGSGGAGESFGVGSWTIVLPLPQDALTTASDKHPEQ